ncbi:MAG: hypothetical protein ACR2RF_18195 [Geminicoccaceae bacterium]
MTGRSDLDIDLADLDDFQPVTPQPASASTEARAQEKKLIAKTAYFPSREADDRNQLNIGVSTALKNRFKDLSVSTGLRHYALLEQALDAFERERGNK